MLFDSRDRSDSSPKLDGEREFAFLNRSSRPEMGRVRDLLERLVTQYPTEHRTDLVARIRSNNDTEFESATFELLLHELLRRLGYDLELHPALSNGKLTRPDFLLRREGAQGVFLEATSVSSVASISPAEEALMGTTLDALRKASHPDFRISIQSSGAPTTQASGSRLRKDVLRWLDALDPEAKGDSPRLTWVYEGWRLTMSAVPLSAARRGTSGSLVGAVSRGSWVNNWEPISDAVRHKGRRYGNLDAPLVVAVNAGSFHTDVRDEIQALFGQETVTLAVDESEADPSFGRAPNGAFRGPEGPRSTRVSAVWMFNAVSPYTISSRRHMLYINPWAKHVLSGMLGELPRTEIVEDWTKTEPGINLGEALGLNAHWPEGD